MFASVFAAGLTLLPYVLPAAQAGVEDDATDFVEGDEEGKPKKKKGAAESAGAIREITRGFYTKANVGAATYFGQLAPAVSTGTFVGITFGQDFVDNEKQSMAWEISLNQGLHNGLDYLSQSAAVCGSGAPCTEGDLRTYTLAAAYEISFYPTRRVGVGFRAGAGVLYSPLLIPADPWANVVLPAYSDVDFGWHNSPKPVFFGGPTAEYYTKLSHFSVGVDIDVFYGLGWDFGLNATGALKYTF